MKTLIAGVALILSTATAIASLPKLHSTVVDIAQDVERVEINHKEIPEEARMDIIDNFHGAKILKAYKEMENGNIVGYLVEIEKGPKKWTLHYDKDGNSTNKVKPQL